MYKIRKVRKFVSEFYTFQFRSSKQKSLVWPCYGRVPICNEIRFQTFQDYRFEMFRRERGTFNYINIIISSYIVSFCNPYREYLAMQCILCAKDRFNHFATFTAMLVIWLVIWLKWSMLTRNHYPGISSKWNISKNGTSMKCDHSWIRITGNTLGLERPVWIP